MEPVVPWAGGGNHRVGTRPGAVPGKPLAKLARASDGALTHALRPTGSVPVPLGLFRDGLMFKST